MNLSKPNLSLALVSIFVLASACQKNDNKGQPAAAKPQVVVPAPQGVPMANGQGQQPSDLIAKDKQRRDAAISNLTIHNPDIDRSIGLIKKGSISDILSANIQLQTQGDMNIASGLKLVVAVREKDSVSTLNFSTGKKLIAKGNYESLKLESGNTSASAEARCLVTCDYVLAKLHRGSSGEIAFVFKSMELMQIPNFEQDNNTSRIVGTSHIMELSFLYAQELDNSQRAILSAIEKVAKNGGGVASGQLENIKKDLAAALEEAYTLSGFSLKNAGVKWNLSPDQISVSGNRLSNTSRNIAVLLGDLHSPNKVQFTAQSATADVEKDLNAASVGLTQAQQRLALIVQLISQATK